MNDGPLSLSHETLAGCADQRDGLGEENTHRVAEGDRLLVGPALHGHLPEGGGRQVDRGVQGQRRELLALRLLNRLRLLLGELAEAAQEILGISSERKAEAASFHEASVTVRPQALSCLCSPLRMPRITWRHVRCDQASGTRHTSMPAHSETA